MLPRRNERARFWIWIPGVDPENSSERGVQSAARHRGVRIERQQERRPPGPRPAVGRGREAEIAVRGVELYLGILGAHHLSGPVGRVVVDDDDAHAHVGRMGPERIEAAPQELAAAVGDDDDVQSRIPDAFRGPAGRGAHPPFTST